MEKIQFALSTAKMANNEAPRAQARVDRDPRTRKATKAMPSSSDVSKRRWRAACRMPQTPITASGRETMRGNVIGYQSQGNDTFFPPNMMTEDPAKSRCSGD